MKMNINNEIQHSIERSSYVDVFFFLAPLLFSWITPIYPMYLTGLMRIFSAKLLQGLHYALVDKDNYHDKLSQDQLTRERKEYITPIILHMWVQLLLQILFPGMFFTPVSEIPGCIKTTLMSHVFVVELLYYAAHRWLHIPKYYQLMHSFHHQSIHPIPTTSLVQDYKEHFIYIATFGPAMLLPYFVFGVQHWIVIGSYLVLFDIANAYGHTNIKVRSLVWTHQWSPLRYLFYTPEFHLGHHALFQCNYGLFMPIWDFIFGTYRHYERPPMHYLPAKQQDFVFIGHNGGLGHFLGIPELGLYNVYGPYVQTGLPLKWDLYVAWLFMTVARNFTKSYHLPRYLIEKMIGRVVCIMRSPLDYMNSAHYDAINQNIVDLILQEYSNHNTKHFGLGNLNKMLQLNDGGRDLVTLISKHPVLKDQGIIISTGDTLTAASVYNQIKDIRPSKVLFFGMNGKIGTAVCSLLLNQGVHVCAFTSYRNGLRHPNLTYTDNWEDIQFYQLFIVGKYVDKNKLTAAVARYPFNGQGLRYVLDYAVPFFPITEVPGLRHIQIGLLEVKNPTFLKGYYDISFGIDQNMIYPCHAGCIINALEGRQEHEVGVIDVNSVENTWLQASKYGLQNRNIDVVVE